MNDKHYMGRALQLAHAQLGNTSPNPAVGAVLVKDDQIIAEGVTQKPGEDHAEIVAMKHCSPKGATLYTTLEPCSHTHKRTLPCVPRIIKAGIRRVVIAVRDVNPAVDGDGIKQLKDAGIDVTVGVLEKEARQCHEFFFKWITTGKPFVTIKAALTMNGHLTWGDGIRKRITGEESLKKVHTMRKQYDAILIGVNTVIKDNPQLTTRHVDGTNPTRVILDSQLKIPTDAALLKREGKTLIFTTIQGTRDGAEIIALKDNNGLVDVQLVLEELGKRGITSLLVEGGAKVIASFLNNRVVDKGNFFVAPFEKEGEGFFELLKENVLRLHDIRTYKHGEDLMIEGYL